MKKYIIGSFALAIIALSSCSDDDIIRNPNQTQEGNVINFGTSIIESRANYNDGIDSKQVCWEGGEKIRIFCNQALLTADGTVGSAKADYIIALGTDKNTSDEHNSLATIEKTTNPLLWGDENVEHNFYAVYPADDKIKMNDEGVITFPINRNQICKIREKKDGEKYTYVAEPVDENIYMVASSTVNPSNLTEDAVWLHFKPIMTTVNIVIKGPESTDVNADEMSEMVTGVSIISTIKTSTKANRDYFNYKITDTGGYITGEYGTGNPTEETETTFVSVVDTDGLNAVNLKTGETLCLTAFLPPMATDVAEKLERDVKIRVHTTGGQKTQSLEDAKLLLPSAKGSIKLPTMWTPITGANWITPLDGDIYVSQMSIPGSHDAGTGRGTSLLDAGQTQALDITGQWNEGIRCFDFRPAVSRDYDNYILNGFSPRLQIWHGTTRTEYLWDEAIQEILQKLKSDESKGEFAIILFRHESEGIGVYKHNEEAWQDSIANYLKKFKELYPNNICTEFKKDLTINDLRGRILFLTRDYYASTDVAQPIGAWASPWGDNSGSDGNYKTNCRFNEMWYDGSTSKDGITTSSPNYASVYLQDYYDASNSTNKMLSAIRLLNKTATFHTDEAMVNQWAINHFSGYQGSSGESTDYLENAKACNETFYRYLRGESVTVGTETFPSRPVGSTGIVLFDWVGADTWDDQALNGILGDLLGTTTYHTYGAQLPQMIIDNNYKYRMKRKGE